MGLRSIVLSVLLALAAGRAVAAERIVWAVLDFPPFQIIDGPYRGSGSFDGLLDELIRRMPEYQHEVVPMSFARREQEVRDGRPVCTPGIFKTPEREKLTVFSKPSLIHLDNRLVFLASRAAELGGADPVDLEGVIARRDLVIGVSAQRSFAPNIDPVLARHAGDPNLLLRSLKTGQLFELLLKGEIDATIMFPHEAAFLAHGFGVEGRVATRRIAGTPPYIITHAACTKGTWGEAVMARIDAILDQMRDDADYRALSERWYVPEDRERIRGFFPAMVR
jgi:uncharacterized protein (TIGR02285 family)